MVSVVVATGEGGTSVVGGAGTSPGTSAGADSSAAVSGAVAETAREATSCGWG